MKFKGAKELNLIFRRLGLTEILAESCSLVLSKGLRGRAFYAPPKEGWPVRSKDYSSLLATANEMIAEGIREYLVKEGGVVERISAWMGVERASEVLVKLYDRNDYIPSIRLAKTVGKVYMDHNVHWSDSENPDLNVNPTKEGEVTFMDDACLRRKGLSVSARQPFLLRAFGIVGDDVKGMYWGDRNTQMSDNAFIYEDEARAFEQLRRDYEIKRVHFKKK
jgi:hypothetical protein